MSDARTPEEGARPKLRKHDLRVLVIGLVILIVIVLAAIFILSGWQLVANLALGFLILSALGIRLGLSFIATRDFTRGE